MCEVKIYTKTGDGGKTHLANGTYVDKDSLRVEVYGSIDELHWELGVIYSLIRKEKFSDNIKKELIEILSRIEEHLFNLASYLALSEKCKIENKDVLWVEKAIDMINKNLPPLKKFLKYHSSFISSALQHARSVCRRAERRCVTLSKIEDLGDFVLPYLNRLSDLLFVMARYIEITSGFEERIWKKK